MSVSLWASLDRGGFYNKAMKIQHGYFKACKISHLSNEFSRLIYEAVSVQSIFDLDRIYWAYLRLKGIQEPKQCYFPKTLYTEEYEGLEMTIAMTARSHRLPGPGIGEERQHVVQIRGNSAPKSPSAVTVLTLGFSPPIEIPGKSATFA